jgi:RNA:NAD 2'-phosphotransferase (TPT1/KptA family)
MEVLTMKVLIINKENERYNKVYDVVENNQRFCTIQDGDIKADYGHSEIVFVCVTCGTVDLNGLINGMCTNCYDMYLDIGKTGKEIDKKKTKDSRELETRRQTSGYYNIMK